MPWPHVVWSTGGEDRLPVPGPDRAAEGSSSLPSAAVLAVGERDLRMADHDGFADGAVRPERSDPAFDDVVRGAPDRDRQRATLGREHRVVHAAAWHLEDMGIP